MALVPGALLDALEGVPGFDRQAFVAMHAAAEKVTSIRINPAKYNIAETSTIGAPTPNTQLQTPNPVPWSQYGYYLAQRPSFTFDPLFHAGCYYVQEASSMFLEQAVKQCIDVAQPLKVLDLCAAPGGKSTHLQSLIGEESLLVSNEVIKTRAGILKQNITKWGGANVVVTSNDPQHFQRLEGFFDVLVVDAPCSGSGLFRRDAEAVAEWSEDAVQLCCGRQRRILADALPCLKAGGILIYATCSYSKEEDEEIGDWLMAEQDVQSLRLRITENWGIVETASEKKGAYGYRFFPHKLQGEGFYLAAFRKPHRTGPMRYKAGKADKATAAEQSAVLPWLKQSGLTVLKERFLYALPTALLEAYVTVKGALYVQQAGVPLGEVLKGRLVPDHALALSGLLRRDVAFTDLSLEEAIRYLQRQDVALAPLQKGWQTVRYAGHNLGWINALPARINNYYPKELRILKQ